jgi:hypothetical protein
VRRRARWEWKSDKISIELKQELDKSILPHILKGELGSSIVDLCEQRRDSPDRLSSGRLRVLDIAISDQHLYVFYARSLSEDKYIGLHVTLVEGRGRPRDEAYELARLRLQRAEIDDRM